MPLFFCRSAKQLSRSDSSLSLACYFEPSYSKKRRCSAKSIYGEESSLIMSSMSSGFVRPSRRLLGMACDGRGCFDLVRPNGFASFFNFSCCSWSIVRLASEWKEVALLLISWLALCGPSFFALGGLGKGYLPTFVRFASSCGVKYF